MANVVLDIVSGTRLREQNGRIVEASRIATVTRLTPSRSVVFDALTAAGMPVAGDSHPEDTDLVLEERLPTVLGPSAVRVELVYRLQQVSEVTFRGSSSLQQITRSTDRNGVPFTLTSNTGQQRNVPLSVLDPQDTLIAEVVIQTAEPGTVSRSYNGKVNSTTFQGSDEGTWMCAHVDWNPKAENVSPKKWLFIFTLQFNADGWDPTGTLRDPDTGDFEHPLVEGQNIKTFPYYERANFNNLFGI